MCPCIVINDPIHVFIAMLNKKQREKRDPRKCFLFINFIVKHNFLLQTCTHHKCVIRIMTLDNKNKKCHGLGFC